MNKAKKRNLMLPYFVLDIMRFLLGYQALRLFDRIKITGKALLRWMAIFYVPIYAWTFGNMLKYFWNWNGGPAESAAPFFLGWIPLPFFYPLSGNFFAWLLCILIGVAWALICTVVLNVIVERTVTQERIEEKWRRACLHVGLVTNTNLIADEDVKEFPPVVTVTPKSFVIQAKGFTPEIIQEKRTELSAAMGLFIGDVQFLRKPDGSTWPDLLELSYAWNDLPAKVPLVSVPVAGPGNVVLGLGMQGFHTVSLEEAVHLGVSGETGSGKSVFLRSLVTQLMVTDRDAIIVGIDFKGGAEFAIFESFGNFICVDEYEGAAHALRSVFDEYKRRVAQVRAGECDSVFQLRASKGLSIPPIVIIIDEAAEFWQSDKGVSRVVLQDAFTYVDKLARLGRFAGIHLFVCTQRASADVIPSQVRSMLTTRVVFKVSQKEDSIMMLGSAVATKLRKVAGRFYLRAPDGNLKELQAPYLSKAEAKDILSRQPAPAESELVNTLRKNVWKMRLAA